MLRRDAPERALDIAPATPRSAHQIGTFGVCSEASKLRSSVLTKVLREETRIGDSGATVHPQSGKIERYGFGAGRRGRIAMLTPDEVRGQAIPVLEQVLRPEGWDALRVRFSARMKDECTRTLWERTCSESRELLGTAQTYGEPVVDAVGSLMVARVPMTFERAEMMGRASFNERGEIAGLWVLRPDAGLAQT